MKQKHKGLGYVGDEGAFSRYTFWLEDRRIFDVLVDNGAEATDVPDTIVAEPGVTFHPISIARVDAPTDTRQPTKGFAAKVLSGVVDNEGMPIGLNHQISQTSVSAYVTPRVPYLLARLFVPAAA